MIAALLAAALVGHNPGFEDRPPIRAQADAIELQHRYNDRGQYEESRLMAFDSDGAHLWSEACAGPWMDSRWPTMPRPGLVELRGVYYRTRRVRERWGHPVYGWYHGGDHVPERLVPGY